MTERRRLAAILVADVVGYSKLVGADETGTLVRLAALRRDLIEPAIDRHSGRLFKEAGDGFLVEFSSAVQAVAAAQAIQQANEAGELRLRIGIHVGDVVVQGDDLMGDGVNIATRIEGVAEAGGIAISREVHAQVRDRLDATFVDRGEVTLKNIARPIQVFTLGGGGGGAEPVLPAPVLPDKPSIAVLPFQNMSGDPEQEYFADGMVEDIITALSRFKSLFVIARNSSFTYKGRAVDIKQVGRELGVRYVLEGSIRKAGGKVRITGQLIDSEAGAHLWADRFDGMLEDVFELQDQMTSRVVGAVAPKLDQAEIDRARRKPAENLDAYDCFLRGLAHSYQRTRDSNEEALRFFYRAIELDPDYATPYGLAAVSYNIRKVQGWVTDREREEAEVRRLTLRVSAIGRDDALALSCAGHALVGVCREIETGAAMIEQALSINQNLALGWFHRGVGSVFRGEHERAMEQISRAMRLSPLDPAIYTREGMMAQACFQLGRHEQAVSWATRALARQPNWMPALRAAAAANALAGNIDEARKIMLRLRKADPGLSLSNLPSVLSQHVPENIVRMTEGLRLAGLPE